MTTVYEGKLFDVVEEEGYEIVDHPGSVAIVPVDRDGRVVLVRQRRVPARAELVQLPAGTQEPGEEPGATAGRERRGGSRLRGGAGRRPRRFWATPGFVGEPRRRYLADDVDA